MSAAKWGYAGGSAALGLASVMAPLGVWWLIIDRQVRNPNAFHDQGGMAILFFCFPLASVGWLAFGLPAGLLGLRAVRSARTWAVRGLGIMGLALAALGLVAAVGTCIIPQSLVSEFR